MGKIGELLGWIAAVCYFISVANLFIKQFFKAKISNLPKENTFRKEYQIFMSLVLRYHRYFGMAAGTFALLHLCWQIINVRLSYSGALSAALMAVTASLGIFIAYKGRTDLKKIHRPVALSVLVVILFHLVTKI